MNKIITFLGWTFCGLFLALGLFAWARLPSRFSIVLGADEPGAGSSAETEQLQRVALNLEGRVEELEGTVEVLIGELERRGEATARAERETARAEQQAARDRELLAELRVQLGGLERRGDTLERLLGEWIAGREAAAAAPAESAMLVAGELELVAEEPFAGEALADEPLADEPLADGPVEPERAVEAEPDDGGVQERIGFDALLARKRWKLWDEPTTFRIVGAASEVAFDGSSTVHDFSGSTREVKGSLRFDFSDPTRDPQASIVVDATSLDTKDEDRDAEMHADHLQSATYPELTFTLTAVRDARQEGGGDVLQATAAGTFEIHGQEVSVELPVTLSKRPGRRVLIEGRCPLKMSRFGIDPPTALAGVIKTSDDILVRVRLEAEAVKP